MAGQIFTPEQEAAILALNAKQQGAQGFGKVNKSPQVLKAEDEMNLAAIAASNNLDDADSLAMMNTGMNRVVPYGGKLSWAQALNDGVRQGMGMYNMLSTQESKRKQAEAMANYLRAKGQNDVQKPISTDASNPLATPFKKDPYSRADLLTGEPTA